MQLGAEHGCESPMLPALTKKDSMQYDCHDEPLFSLTDADLAILKADKTMIDFALTTFVPDEIRRECEAELAAAKENGYVISKK